jgi:exosortase A
MTDVWRQALIRLALAILALLAIFHRDVADMAAIWWTVSTYTHCLLILPLVAWLIWQRRSEVARLAPRAYPPALALVFVGALVWMLGEAAGVALLRHAGLIFLVQASVLALLGPRVVRGLLFPIFYLVFLIPFGDELVPALQTVTARLSMLFLGLAGIPARLDGVFISTPTGLFEVAEACSGVKFLVAMVAYGALVANVCFSALWRRIAFMAVAIVVPILANGLRTYATIHISYATGDTRFAESFDHIIFGWVFFGIVMALVMAIGWKFFDRGVNDRWLGTWADTLIHPVRPTRLPMVAAILLMALIPLGWDQWMAARGRVAAPNAIDLPTVLGWVRVPIDQAHPWQPRFDGADHTLFGQYADARGQRVDVSVALYAWQDEGREVVGYRQGAFDPESRWSWASDAEAPSGGKAVRIFAPGVEREVLSFYRVGGMTTGNPRSVKMQTLKTRLTGGDQAAVALLISAEKRPGQEPRVAIGSFLTAAGEPGALADRLLETARGGR